MKYVISNKGVVNSVVAGKTYTFDKNHPNYTKLVGYLIDGNVEYFEADYDIASAIDNFCEGYIDVKNGTLQWDGIEMPELFTERIVQMKSEGFNFLPMLEFLNNMNENPSDHAITELFDFMQHEHLPITDDGHFLAYKAVDKDFKDKWSHTFDNSVGSKVSVDRASVDSNRDHGCSNGLHVGSLDYVKSYGNEDSGDQFLVVKVNPMDVVSVPTCSRFQKLRCSQYEVVSLFTDPIKDSVHITDKAPVEMKVVHYDKAWKDNIRERIESLAALMTV
jgi:hypothetical protein